MDAYVSTILHLKLMQASKRVDKLLAVMFNWLLPKENMSKPAESFSACKKYFRDCTQRRLSKNSCRVNNIINHPGRSCAMYIRNSVQVFKEQITNVDQTLLFLSYKSSPNTAYPINLHLSRHVPLTVDIIMKVYVSVKTMWQDGLSFVELVQVCTEESSTTTNVSGIAFYSLHDSFLSVSDEV